MVKTEDHPPSDVPASRDGMGLIVASPSSLLYFRWTGVNWWYPSRHNDGTILEDVSLVVIMMQETFHSQLYLLLKTLYFCLSHYFQHINIDFKLYKYHWVRKANWLMNFDLDAQVKVSWEDSILLVRVGCEAQLPHLLPLLNSLVFSTISSLTFMNVY